MPEVYFPVSGVDVPIWLPPLVSFTISLFTSMVGVSGAFILLPFQVSVLGFTSPAVSPTNLVYNIIAIPSGVYRYFRDGRLLLPLTIVIIAGTLPGVIAGGFIRLEYFPDPKLFKLFAGFVLLYIAFRMFIEMTKKEASKNDSLNNINSSLRHWKARTINISLREYEFEFQNKVYICNNAGIFFLSLIVGLVGGIYGIGGGAIISPFLVAVYRLPVYAIAGSALTGTFVTSIAGVLFYQLIAPAYETSSMSVSPDWALGTLFGIGGLIGVYFGARMQRFFAVKWLKLMLGLMLLSISVNYISGYFLS